MQGADTRWISWGVFILAIAGLVAWALWPRAVEVDVVSASLGGLVVTLDEEGETRVRERFVVSAPVAGRLLRIELEPGDAVVAGETVLATFQPQDATLLDPRSRAEAEAEVRALDSALERARHERERARADLEFAKRDCDRDRLLLEREVLSAERMEISELTRARAMEDLRAAEAGVEAARHRLASARARLLNLGSPGRRGDEPLRIKAPIDGVVLRRILESESVVAAGAPILEVGVAQDLEVVADYLSRDAVRIVPGARVLVDRWGGEGILQAEVRRVEPSGFTKVSALGVEEQRVNVVIDLLTPPEERPTLADGYRVETRIVVAECDGVVQVPSGSLFREGGGWAAFVIEDGRARLRSVELGARTPASVEVKSGLSEGEKVISHPADTVSEGVRVRPREAN